MLLGYVESVSAFGRQRNVLRSVCTRSRVQNESLTTCNLPRHLKIVNIVTRRPDTSVCVHKPTIKKKKKAQGTVEERVPCERLNPLQYYIIYYYRDEQLC